VASYPRPVFRKDMVLEEPKLRKENARNWKVYEESTKLIHEALRAADKATDKAQKQGNNNSS
jgi:hypothetical protein